MHYVGIVFASKNEAGATHVSCVLINFIKLLRGFFKANYFIYKLPISQVTNSKFISI
jgi:hypothetical protein